MTWIRRIVFPPWTLSTSRARTWLHFGFRLSLTAIGVLIILGVHKPYTIIPLVVMTIFLVADFPFARRDKRLGRVS